MKPSWQSRLEMPKVTRSQGGQDHKHCVSTLLRLQTRHKKPISPQADPTLLQPSSGVKMALKELRCKSLTQSNDSFPRKKVDLGWEIQVGCPSLQHGNSLFSLTNDNKEKIVPGHIVPRSGWGFHIWRCKLKILKRCLALSDTFAMICLPGGMLWCSWTCVSVRMQAWLGKCLKGKSITSCPALFVSPPGFTFFLPLCGPTTRGHHTVLLSHSRCLMLGLTCFYTESLTGFVCL